MITEDFVSFETATLLKEKEFRCDTLHYYYDKDGDLFFSAFRVYVGKNEFVAPTLQMAMKWLREVHNIGVFPLAYSFRVEKNGSDKHVYGTTIINLETYELMTNDMMPMPTYEGAIEARIKYCLENLI